MLDHVILKVFHAVLTGNKVSQGGLRAKSSPEKELKGKISPASLPSTLQKSWADKSQVSAFADDTNHTDSVSC